MSEPAAQDPGRGRKRRWLLISGLVAGSVLIIVAGVIGFVLLYRSTARPMQVGPPDRAVVVSADDLAHFVAGFAPNPEVESMTKIRYIDGSFDIDYEYDDAESSDAPYLHCAVTIDPSAADARTTYSVSKLAGDAAMTFGSGIKLVPKPGFYEWGEQSSYTSIETAEGQLGLHFLARSGARTFDLTLAGVYFDDAELFDRLVSPALQALETYEP